MSDRAALLAAIFAQPDEDTPRLVYADWLDEHGESKRARAIRAAVAHHRLSTADTTAAVVSDFLRSGFAPRTDWAAVDADLGACQAAERAMQTPHLTLKREGVPRVPGVSFSCYERGFFHAADIADADSFLAHADTIFRAAPITRLRFWALTPAQAEKFVAAGHLARVRELMVTNNAEPAALRVLGTHRDAAGVRKLELNTFEHVRDKLDALAAGAHWTGLEHLDVSGLRTHGAYEGADDGQLAVLFARPQFRALRRLTAWGSQVGDRAVKAIARNLPELRVLDLSSNPISARGWSALAASKTLPHLRRLDLDSCATEEADAAPLVTAPNLPNLAVLLIGGNDLTATSPKVLARSGRGPGLRALALDSSHLTAEAAAVLAACPAVSGLWHLDLSVIELDDEYLERFLARTAFERLASLDLSFNVLTARGARALARWPGAASLQWLGVSGNPIGEAGAKALAASPYLTTLKYISADGRGVAILKRRFKKGLVR